MNLEMIDAEAGRENEKNALIERILDLQLMLFIMFVRSETDHITMSTWALEEYKKDSSNYEFVTWYDQFDDLFHLKIKER